MTNDLFPSPELIQQILRVAGLDSGSLRARQLERDLSKLSDIIQSYRNVAAMPGPAQLRRALDLMYRRSTRLLEALGVDPRSGRPDLLPEEHAAIPLLLWQLAAGLEPRNPEAALQDDRARDELRAILNSIYRLRGAALRAKQVVPRQTAGHGGARRGPDLALQATVDYLVSLYKESTGAPVTLTFDPYKDTANSPLGEFLTVPPGAGLAANQRRHPRARSPAARARLDVRCAVGSRSKLI